MIRWISFTGGGLLLALLAAVAPGSAAKEKPFPDAVVDSPLAAQPGGQAIVLAGGCFWGVQAVFQHLGGVTSATSGYAGGTAKTASYPFVSSGATDHAESVRVVFDPSRLTLGQILKIFFAVAHDPTEVNRQGPDEGRQYRSAIFYSGEDQKRVADAYVAQLNEAGIFKRRIATEIVPLTGFYAAESYHQDYADKHPFDPYIVINDRPKVDALRKRFPSLYVDRR